MGLRIESALSLPFPSNWEKQITQHSSKVNLINDHGLVLYGCAGLPENPAVLFAAVV
jgi:hypothetical protein